MDFLNRERSTHGLKSQLHSSFLLCGSPFRSQVKSSALCASTRVRDVFRFFNIRGIWAIDQIEIHLSTTASTDPIRESILNSSPRVVIDKTRAIQGGCKTLIRFNSVLLKAAYMWAHKVMLLCFIGQKIDSSIFICRIFSVNDIWFSLSSGRLNAPKYKGEIHEDESSYFSAVLGEQHVCNWLWIRF